MPNREVDPSSGDSNFVANYVTTAPGWQLDGKIDYYFNDRNFLTGRYYMRRETDTFPNPFLSESVTDAKTEGITLSDNWTINPSLLWVNRVTSDTLQYAQPREADGRSFKHRRVRRGFP